MVRTVLTPEAQNISIRVPESFVGKKVEVIVSIAEEGKKKNDFTDQPLTYIASEKTLAKDWSSAEEDEAWQDL